MNLELFWDLFAEEPGQILSRATFAFVLFATGGHFLLVVLFNARAGLDPEEFAGVLAQSVEDELSLRFAALGVAVFVVESAVRATVQPGRTLFAGRVLWHGAVHPDCDGFATLIAGGHFTSPSSRLVPVTGVEPAKVVAAAGPRTGMAHPLTGRWFLRESVVSLRIASRARYAPDLAD